MKNSTTENDVMHEYESTLIVPVQPSRKLFILCPVGLVGAGKTTVVKPIAEKLSLVRISGDDIRKLLSARGLKHDLVAHIGPHLIKKYLLGGFSVAIDSDSLSPRNRKLIDDCEQVGLAIPIWIHVKPPEEFILKKLRLFKHTYLFKDTDEAVSKYYSRKSLHENLDMPFVYVFDTSSHDIDSQIEEAVKIIEKKVHITK